MYIKKTLKAVSLCLMLGACQKTYLPETSTERLAYQNEPIINALKTLVQSDIDSYYVYNESIERAKERHIKEILTAFKWDHERRIGKFSTHILQLGGTPPSFSRDARGMLATTRALIAGSVKGTKGLLNSIQSAETDTHEVYKKVAQIDMPAYIKADVKHSLEEEQHHLNLLLKEKEGSSQSTP